MLPAYSGRQSIAAKCPLLTASDQSGVRRFFVKGILRQDKFRLTDGGSAYRFSQPLDFHMKISGNWVPFFVLLFLLVVSLFGFLAFPPSTECRLRLLAKISLAWVLWTLFWSLVKDRRCTASAIFHAWPPHTVAAACSGPINATAHLPTL